VPSRFSYSWQAFRAETTHSSHAGSHSRSKQRRQGLRPVRILLDENPLRRAHSLGAPNEHHRHDVEALQKALLGLLYRAEQDLP
jgi:hypothetical protein